MGRNVLDDIEKELRKLEEMRRKNQSSSQWDLEAGTPGRMEIEDALRDIEKSITELSEHAADIEERAAQEEQKKMAKRPKRPKANGYDECVKNVNKSYESCLDRAKIAGMAVSAATKNWKMAAAAWLAYKEACKNGRDDGLNYCDKVRRCLKDGGKKPWSPYLFGDPWPHE